MRFENSHSGSLLGTFVLFCFFAGAGWGENSPGIIMAVCVLVCERVLLSKVTCGCHKRFRS